VNCSNKSGFYFNEEQSDRNICLENDDGDDGGHDWKIVADTFNVDQQTTFQSYVMIDDNVVVSGLLTGNEILGISILNSSDSKNDENDESIIIANQVMASLQTFR